MSFSTKNFAGTKYLTKSPVQTKKLGKDLAQNIIKMVKDRKKAVFLGLRGGLGGGKTTFVQGFARRLGIKEKITSPTFVLIKRYKIPRSNPWLSLRMLRGRQNARYEIRDFYHIDCYRLKKPKELLDLGFREIIKNPQNIVAVEWAEKIKKIAPGDAIWLKFNFISDKKREISINKF